MAICLTMLSISWGSGKVKCSLGENLMKKKTARVRQGIKEKIQNEQKESTFIISIAGCEFIVNSWQKKRALAVLTEKAMANRPRKGCPFMMSIP